MIRTQLEEVKKRIEEACLRSGRDPGEVTLIAVSKTKPVSMIREAMEAGQTVFGENKVQELCSKYEELPKTIQWHMIGHLQRNKVKYIADKAALIHSVDSLRLAETIEQEGAKHQRVIPILIEVNVAGEDTKFGVSVEEALPLIQQIAPLPHVKIRGLMTIAPFVEDPGENRPVFAALRQLSVDIKGKNMNNVDMDILSMGMTNDYEVAVEEGATMVRVGTGIFGARDYSAENR
ncbi:MAG TPA: YggS family pyridoxal phosphate-dependent enzyme [Candidatus Pullilachnospira intestinigallinarum]|nr:YggS family pyridoxal phosphate-dependent enzyme [Candidatus Pullilachnospira intestinigallinarum]